MTLANTVTPERFFLGVTLEKRPDWEAFLMEPEATRSSKPESIQKEVAEKKAKQAEQAHTYPVSGTVQAAVLLDSAGNVIFTTFHDTTQAPGDVSMRTLYQLWQLGLHQSMQATPEDCGVRLFGFHISDRLQLMYMDALHYGVVTRTPVDIPPGLWYHKPFESAPWADPFHMLVSSDRRDKDIDRQGLCDFLSIPCPDDLMEDPAVQANVARLMALRGQLFPAPANLAT